MNHEDTTSHDPTPLKSFILIERGAEITPRAFKWRSKGISRAGGHLVSGKQVEPFV